MGQIQQSVSWWCFADVLPPEQLARTVAEIGYQAVELIGQEHWPVARDNGLAIAAIGGQRSITEGLNRRQHHDHLEREILTNLKLAEQWGIANLIVFSGNRGDLDDDAGIEHTVEGLRRVCAAAEDAGVTLLLELLNSKVDHPDYQCDSTAWGAQVCRAVNSPRVKLLYDIYHMQVMEGDIIRTIQQYAELIGHFHTAGNPGRHEIDERQEIYYPPIARAIKDSGYHGYIGQEFLPTGDPVAALRRAFTLCNPD